MDYGREQGYKNTNIKISILLFLIILDLFNIVWVPSGSRTHCTCDVRRTAFGCPT